MDTTENTQTQKPRRIINILCAIDRHKYCDLHKEGGCGCDCHQTIAIAHSGTTLSGFAYNLWRVASAISFMDEEERQARFEDLIEAADGTVDFKGIPKDVLLAKLKLTLERDYWSARETNEELGIK